MRTESQPDRPADRAVPRHGVHGPPLRPAGGRLAIATCRPSRATDAEAFFDDVLRPVEHGRRDRRRREGGRGHPGRREVLRPPARQARSPSRSGRSSRRRSPSARSCCARPSQPVYIEGYHSRSALPPGRRRLRRDLPTCSRTGRTSRLYRSLVRDKKIAAARRRLQRLPRRQVPEPVRLLRGPDAGPHATRRCRTRSARRSSGSRTRTSPTTSWRWSRRAPRPT